MNDSWLQVVRLDDWDQFKKRVTAIARDGIEGHPASEMLYRGQSLASFGLSASLDRMNSNRDVAWRNRLQKSAVETFCSRNPEIASTLSADQVLAILQHNGCPTRLLDWSRSPYVAAFFALSATLEAASDEESCAVWALWARAPQFQAEAGVRVAEVASNQNSRSWAQRGVFTSNSSLSTSLDEYLRQWNNGSPIGSPVLWKFLIPRTEALDARRDLALMGIDYHGMFPDLVGAARAAYYSGLESMRSQGL